MNNAFNNESDAHAFASLLFLFMHSDYGHIVNPDLAASAAPLQLSGNYSYCASPDLIMRCTATGKARAFKA